MSEKVKRWAGGECGGCIESPDGEHVKYEDYQRLEKQLDETREAIRELYHDYRWRDILKAAGVEE